MIFGGNNDENISNKFFAYKHETSSWLTHKINENHSIIPRKGHSAIITKSNIITIENVNEDVIQIYNLVIFGGKSVNTYLNDLVIIKAFYVVLDDRIYFKYMQLENNKEIIGDFPEPREGHKAFIENDYLYIYGGCNYTIKKCYFDSVYKLNLKNSPLKWEKEALIVNKLKEDSKINYFTQEKIQFNNLKNGEKISNLIPYKDAFISIGICEANEDYCKNQFNIVFPHSTCMNDNDSKNIECFLESENKENKFDWVYQCEKRNKKKTNNLKENIENQNNVKNSTNKRNDYEYLNLENSRKQENMNNIADFDNSMNKLIQKNNLDSIFEDRKKNINSDLIQIREKPLDENKINSLNLNSFLQKNNDHHENSNSNSILKIQNNFNSQTKLNEMLLTEKLLEILNIKNLIQNSNYYDQIHKKFEIKNISQNNDGDFSIDINDKFKSKINQNKTKISNFNKIKNISRKSLGKRSKKSRILNETDLIKKMENKFSENFTNTTLKLFENLDHKLEYYINKTESSNRLNNLNMKKIMEENLKIIKDENLNLKKIIFNNEIKPYLKNDLFRNNSKQEINFLNFDEKVLNVSQQIRKKASDEFKLRTLKELQKNSYLTTNLVKNISEIKNMIDKENKDYKNHFDNLLANLIKKIEGIDNIIEKKFTRVSNFISSQESINNSTKEYLRKEELRKSKVVKQCFNGFLLNETTCQCLPGFSGEDCQIILICQDDCSKNGVCHYGKCFCNPGFSGEKCEKKEMCPNDCNHRGKCHLGKCYCDYGFSGIECEIKLSCEKNCNNRGICFRGQCLCEPGFTGEDCSQVAIKFDSCKNNCNKNGVCKMEKCFCYPGFSGKYCEIIHKFSCPSNLDIDINIKNDTNHLDKKIYSPCNGNGLCKYGMCFCFPGFKGKACEKKEVCKNNCNNNGICIKGKCHCHNHSNTEDCAEIKREEALLNSNNTIYNNQKDQAKSTKNDIRTKSFNDFHFIQIDNEKNTKTDENLNTDIQNAIKIDNAVQNLQSNLNSQNYEDINVKKSHYSIIDEKTGIKYEYNPEGIYVGKETLDKIIYSGMVLLSLTFSIILTIYLNKKFSK